MQTTKEYAYVSKMFPPSKHIQYVGGYPEARKKKIVFLYDEEDDCEFTFLTNAKYIFALDVADFQLKRWLVELFFKWLK